jgi:hypothetical protein
VAGFFFAPWYHGGASYVERKAFAMYGIGTAELIILVVLGAVIVIPIAILVYAIIRNE